MRWVLPIPQQWIIALAIGVVTGVSAQSVPTSKPAAQAAVPDLRFGLIEPPLVAQKVIELRAPSPGIEMTSVGAKGLAAAGNRLMILSARHGNTIFASPLNFTTMRVPTIKGYPLIKDQFMEDPESLTLLPPQPGESLWTAFALGSMSNDALGQVRPRRMLLACAKLDLTVMSIKQTNVVSTEPIRRQLQGYFEKLGVEPYRTYHSEAKGEDKNTNRWGYVEGMSFVPNTTTLMCGMRNPLLREKALVFTVAGVIEACDKKDPALLRVTDLFTLDLGGRGISDLAWDGQTRGYLIAAARSAGPWLDPNLPFPPRFSRQRHLLVVRR
jgi:hypothetical protein